MLSKKGFTVIELLCTLVILSLIFVITVPRVNDLFKTSQREAHKDTLAVIEKAASLYADSLDLGVEGQLPLTVTFKDKKYYYNFAGETEQEGNILELKGEVPDGGTIKIYADKSYDYAIYDKSLNICTKNDNTNYLTVTNAVNEITGFSKTTNTLSKNIGTLKLQNFEAGDTLLLEYDVKYTDLITIATEDSGMYMKAGSAISFEKMKLGGSGVYHVSNTHKVTEANKVSNSYTTKFILENYEGGSAVISNIKVTKKGAKIEKEGEC